MTLRIVTDSTADLPEAVTAEHGITVVPLTVIFGDEELRDGIDITSEQFFTRLQRERQLPTTSQPSSGAFRETYEQLIAEGATEILSIHVGEKLSGTLASARQGADGLDGARIKHIDSKLVSLALGLNVIAAAEAARDGGGLDDVAASVEDRFRRTRIFFLLETLEYLRRGGRIGRAGELVGSLLKVKPVLTVEDGEVVPLARIRTRRKGIEDVLDRTAALRPIEQLAAAHTTTPDDLDYVVSRLRGIAPDAPIITGALGPVVGVHVGPGTIATAVVSARTNGSSPPDQT